MRGGKVQSVLLSWILLLYFDWVMRFGGFSRVHEVLRQRKVRSRSKDRESDPDLSPAVDLACVFYFKRVLCLQRSAALAVLLRHHGTEAKMIIGAQIVPFLSPRLAMSMYSYIDCPVRDSYPASPPTEHSGAEQRTEKSWDGILKPSTHHADSREDEPAQADHRAGVHSKRSKRAH